MVSRYITSCTKTIEHCEEARLRTEALPDQFRSLRISLMLHLQPYSYRLQVLDR